jgi:indole-3-glycerol phosphate synthase
MSDFEEVIKLIDSIKDEQLLEDFLLGLTTKEEQRKLAQRVEIIKRLLANEPQLTIAHDLGVGIATVTRGSKELHDNGRFKVLKEYNESGDSETLIDSKRLNKIIAQKRIRLKARQTQKPYSELEKELSLVKPFKGQSFFDALKSKEIAPKIIAEVKKASPSANTISKNFSLKDINDAYQASPHVVAISVLTEEDNFLGSDEILSFFVNNNKNNKPLLRKDFILEPYQVLESKVLGAQAYLLIAALFKKDTKKLNKLIDLGYEIGIEPLVEVHNREELELVKSTNAKIIGVNCRDLKTFRTNRELHTLLDELDSTYARVAESGISERSHLNHASKFSDVSLIGSRFMKAKNIKKAIEDMVEPAEAHNKVRE